MDKFLDLIVEGRVGVEFGGFFFGDDFVVGEVVFEGGDD